MVATSTRHHYPRLVEIKRRYDPDNVFTLHHGVGTD
jgi:FAD/FMN-containing dehydrogenase